VIVLIFMWQRRLQSKEFFGFVERRMMCEDNDWPTVLIRLCELAHQVRCSCPFGSDHDVKSGRTLGFFLLPLIRISPHDPTLSR
jgi:hypothetical protein